VEPRLLHLLGLEDRSTREPEELFSAWRLFFERLAAGSPVVMVFEDLQWADSALLDFIEYLLEWSRNHALFVMTLARPELQDRHPDWGAGKRNLTSMALEPLSAEAMRDLLTGLAPGLPDDVQAAVLERSEGVPLYAVETIRMLIDRGLLVREGPSYRPVGPVAVLEVPDSLHALIAARLDGLTPEERRLVQHAAVLGKTFTTEALAVLSGVSVEEVAGMLASLQRKEILGLQSDPRSPERGQYGFLQDLVKHVAYETLSRRDRKSLHLAAARHLEQTWPGEEEDIVEILAHHYVQAYQAAPDASDAQAIRAQARAALVRAGERAASLAANGDAQGYFDRALELADDPAEQAGIAARAGEMAAAAARRDAARERFERAIALFNQADMSHAGAMVSAKLAELLWLQFSHLDEALELMESSLSVLAEDEPDEAVAGLMAQAARFHYFRGELDESAAWAERALVVAEAQQYAWVLSQALNTKSLVLMSRGRMEEGFALLKHALSIAEQHDLPDAISRALFNLASELYMDDRCEEALEYDIRHLEHARLLGARTDERMTQIHLVLNYGNLGRWGEVDSVLEEVPLPEEAEQSPVEVVVHGVAAPTLLYRGRLDEMEAVVNAAARVSDPSDMQDRQWIHLMTALLRWGQGRFEDGLTEAEQSLLTREGLGLRAVSTALTVAVECTLELGRAEGAERLLRIAETAAPSQVSRFLRGNVARLRARMAATAGDYEEAEAGFKTAQALFREIGYPLWLAMTQLQHAEALVAADRAPEAAPLLAEARAIFAELGAQPWLERTDQALQASRTAGVVPA
jgi:tetratricopeptide (TPR) repeat protein